MRFRRVGIICLSFFLCSLALADEAAWQRAEQIARKSARVNDNYRALYSEAKKISDAKMRAEFLTLLERPNFTVINARHGMESEIVKQLQAENLLSANFSGPFFPRNEAMPFTAAPGGPWEGHHSFPGGLVYHTLVNLRLGLAYANIYHQVYGLNLDLDLIREATIWHDSAKTLLLPWQADGTLAQTEPLIANTPAHHIWSIAEALFRGFSPRLILALASAHSAPAPASEAEKLVGYLRSAAIIAGKPYSAAGLSADGKRLAHLAPIEAFIIHLDDHDFVLTTASLAEVRKSLSDKGISPWDQDKVLSLNGDLPLYQKLSDPR